MLAVSWDGDGSSVADTNVAVCAVLLGGNGALLHEFKKGEKGDNNFYFSLLLLENSLKESVRAPCTRFASWSIISSIVTRDFTLASGSSFTVSRAASTRASASASAPVERP